MLEERLLFIVAPMATVTPSVPITAVALAEPRAGLGLILALPGASAQLADSNDRVNTAPSRPLCSVI